MNASGNCVCPSNTPNWNATTQKCEAGGNGEEGGSKFPTSWPKTNVIEGDPPGLVNIDYFYDIGGESIFAPPLAEGEEEDPIAALYSNYNNLAYGNSGGIVEDGDIESLIQYLGRKNGNNT